MIAGKRSRVARTPAPLERVVQHAITQALTAIGCEVLVHHGTSRGNRRGSSSARIGFGKGFPDLMVLDAVANNGHGAMYFAEVKRSEDAEPRDEQTVMHDRLSGAGLVVFVWWSPEQAMRDVLKHRSAQARRAEADRTPRALQRLLGGT